MGVVAVLDTKVPGLHAKSLPVFSPKISKKRK